MALSPSPRRASGLGNAEQRDVYPLEEPFAPTQPPWVALPRGWPGATVPKKPPLARGPGTWSRGWCLGALGNAGSVIAGCERDESDKSRLLPAGKLMFNRAEVGPAPGAGVLSEAGVLRRGKKKKSNVFLKCCLQPDFPSLGILGGKAAFPIPVPPKKAGGKCQHPPAQLWEQGPASICSAWEIKVPKKVRLGPQRGDGIRVSPRNCALGVLGARREFWGVPWQLGNGGSESHGILVLGFQPWGQPGRTQAVDGSWCPKVWGFPRAEAGQGATGACGEGKLRHESEGWGLGHRSGETLG